MSEETLLVVVAIVSGFVTGAVLGLVPLIVGIVRKRTTLGVIALAICAICGAILGALLAGPVAIIAAIAIYFASRRGQPATV